MLMFFGCIFLFSFIILVILSVSTTLNSDDKFKAVPAMILLIIAAVSLGIVAFCQDKPKPLTTTQKIQKLESELSAYNEILYIEEKSRIELSSDSKQKILDKYLKED